MRAKACSVEVRRGWILVVEHEESVRRALLRALEPEHHVVTVSHSGLAADRLADHAERFDLVLSAIDMPKLSGLDLYRQVAAKRPDLASRFVFLTAGAEGAEVRTFLSGIPNEEIEKPFSIQNVRAVARRLVDAQPSEAVREVATSTPGRAAR